MTKPVANIDITTESFRTWVNRTNELADAMSNIVLTTNAPVTGNCTVNGEFNALTVSVDSIKGNSSNNVNIDNQFVFNVKPVLPAATIGSNELASGAVTSIKISDNAVTSTKIADGAVDGTKIADGAVGTLKITDNSITTVKIADNAVSTSKISSNAITENKLASGAVTETKIVDSAITTAKLADDAVTPAKLDDTGNFTVSGITAKSIKALEQNSTQEGGQYNIAPPPSATSIDTSYIPFMDLWCNTGGDVLWRFVYKDTGGTIRNITLPLSASGAAGQIWTDKTFDDRIATLTANTAPAGTESVACDNGQKVTLQAIADLAGPDFVSGELTVPDNASVSTAAHGLGATPSRVDGMLVCKTAEMGYSVGDRIKVTGDIAYGLTLFCDPTNVGAAGISNNYAASTKDASSQPYITLANWRLILFAWL